MNVLLLLNSSVLRLFLLRCLRSFSGAFFLSFEDLSLQRLEKERNMKKREIKKMKGTKKKKKRRKGSKKKEKEKKREKEEREREKKKNLVSLIHSLQTKENYTYFSIPVLLLPISSKLLFLF